MQKIICKTENTEIGFPSAKKQKKIIKTVLRVWKNKPASGPLGAVSESRRVFILLFRFFKREMFNYDRHIE